MNQCPICKYFFSNYNLTNHYKLCSIFNLLTGNQNNNMIISRLTQFQKKQVLFYYQNILNKNKNVQNYNKLTYHNNVKTTNNKNYNDNYQQQRLFQYNNQRQLKINNQKQITYNTNYNPQLKINKPKQINTYNTKYNEIAPFNPPRLQPLNSTPTYSNKQIIYKQSNKINMNNKNTTTDIKMINDRNKEIKTVIISPITNFGEYIKYKRIALIGPSKSLIGQHQGLELDNYDLIVRLNKALPIPKSNISELGSRTDILYNSLNTADHPGENNIDPKFFKKNDIKYLCCSYPNIYPFQKDIGQFTNMNQNIQLPFRTLPLDLFDKLERILKCRPYTGICAIMDLLRFNIKELYITGMDFYATGYYKEYSNKPTDLKKLRNNNVHQAIPQIVLLRRIVLNDERIKVDKILHKILFSFYRYVFKYTAQKYSFKDCLLNLNSNKEHTDSNLYKLYLLLNQTKNTTIYLIGNNVRQEDINWIYYNVGLKDIIFSMSNQLTQCALWIDSNSKIFSEHSTMKYQSVISIFRKKYQKYNVDNNNILKFNNKYNMELNQRLKQTDIDNCSISLYVILMTCMYFTQYTKNIKIIGFDFSDRKEETLFIKYLLRQNYIQEVNIY